MSDSSASSRSGEGDWLDIDPEEEETLTFQSLFDTNTFPSLTEMLSYCQNVHSFDFGKTTRSLQLDFHGAIKLVNYLRSYAQSHPDQPVPGHVAAEDLDSEEFLKPFLSNDAVLFTMDEVLEQNSSLGESPLDSAELLKKNKDLEDEIETLRNQYLNYRLAVQETLDRRWGDDGVTSSGEGKSSGASEVPSSIQTNDKTDDKDPGGYFESYAGNDIHETMLKDTVRTDSYRDFMYMNKDLFQDKVVLDIGCGTGILSMFAAKSGASHVFAIDNSAIINKARSNIYHNSLAPYITTLHGAIESTPIPTAVPNLSDGSGRNPLRSDGKVDIIISEWMGYCLLYEAMLPSVLHARDTYLAPGGLMAPSSATMWIAPVSDSEYMAEHMHFWNDVYGFDMHAMQEGIYDDVRVETVPESSVCGAGHPFKVLDLMTCQTKDLSFTSSFECELQKDCEGLDGFVIWFDNFFATSPENHVPASLTKPEEFMKQKQGNVAFTTGPYGKGTHWRQGLLIAPSKKEQQRTSAGSKVTGTVRFGIAEENKRGLDIEVKWGVEGHQRQHLWKLK